MREHLLAYFEQWKLTAFPFYQNRNAKKVAIYKETSSPWNQPRCSTRLKWKTTQQLTKKIKLSSRFETTKGTDWQNNNLSKSTKITSKVVRNKTKTSDTIYNIYSTKLSESEISLLSKGLNFCPTKPSWQFHVQS